jgi:pimeloyl-ACP methyl ester carboxylesterase
LSPQAQGCTAGKQGCTWFRNNAVISTAIKKIRREKTMARLRKTVQLILCMAVVFMFSACVKHLEPGIILYPTPQDNFVRIDTDVRGVQIHYREYPGAGRNIVLIHGFASSTYTWEDMVTKLQHAYKNNGKPGPHIWAVDMKGFGWSDKPADAKYDPFALVDDAYIWMNTVGIDNAIVVGNSLGGAIAWAMALDHPEKVRALVLIDSGGYPMNGDNYTVFSRTPFMQAGADLLFSRKLVAMVLRKAFYDCSKVTDSRIDAYYNRLRTKGGLDSQMLMLKTFDPEQARSHVKRIPDIKQETLIIWGEQDSWIPLKYGHQFHRDIKRSTLAVIPQCGHMPQEEKPAEVADKLYRFLEGIPQLPGQQK